MNIKSDENMKELQRGDIYYLAATKQTGSEQAGRRPVIIVSNDMCNTYSPTITIVPITTKMKKPLPTHVQLELQNVHGIVLCEQVQTVACSRLMEYVNKVDDKTMSQINNALCTQLGLIMFYQQSIENAFDNFKFALIQLKRASVASQKCAKYFEDVYDKVFKDEVKQ